MAWIEIINYDKAKGKLKKLFDKIKGPENYIDNIMLIHSLRPNTLEGHMSLYKNALHHQNNQLPKWLLEAIGGYVSLLNNCQYCVKHHFTGMARELNNKTVSSAIIRSLENDAPDSYFQGVELAIMDYVRKLTLTPGKMKQKDVSLLQVTGITDGEVLEINQVVAYFAYANRTVLGLGVDTKGEIIGLSPGNETDEGDWHHK
ncbi:MAG: alkylhydroperoxidase [Bacteroidetes bacterium]|nr:MAG: alkylhydroperoxidase [Bacteroidota bacterium]